MHVALLVRLSWWSVYVHLPSSSRTLSCPQCCVPLSEAERPRAGVLSALPMEAQWLGHRGRVFQKWIRWQCGGWQVSSSLPRL